MRRARRGAGAFGRRGALATALSCVLALSVALSANVIARLHHHDCTGEDCETCRVVAAAEGSLAASATVAIAALASRLPVGSFVGRPLEVAPTFERIPTYGVRHKLIRVAETPTALKVKLLI